MSSSVLKDSEVQSRVLLHGDEVGEDINAHLAGKI